MLPAELTKKALKDGRTYYCGYCDIEEAVRYLPEIGYNSGVYGWNCTAYACGRFVLVTGYRPAGWRRLTREECHRLNAAARSGPQISEDIYIADLLGLTPQAVHVMEEMNRIHLERCEARYAAANG